MPRYFYPGSARNTVESTLSFSTFWLNRNHYLDGGLSIGGIKWSRNGEETGSMGFSVDINNQLINFNYRSKGYWDKDWQEISYQCKLEKIPCFFGGFRWFFRCYWCNRRCAVLHKSNHYFICRKCADLSYESCNENSRFRQGIFRILGKSWGADEYYQNNVKRQYYNGKPTRKYARYLRMCQYSDRDILEAERVLNRML